MSLRSRRRTKTMSLQDFEQRKLRQQAVNKALEQAAHLFNRLQVYAWHRGDCKARRVYDDTCTCGFTALIKEIDEFLC